MKIYLTGQNNFGNRGCEALVRSTVEVARRQYPSATLLVPSFDQARDKVQWPDAADHGVCFVAAPEVPARFVNWSRLCSRLPLLTRLPWPKLNGSESVIGDLKDCDLVMSIGGDNYSLDYDLASLALFVAIADAAIERGKGAALWGASVGPFSKWPGVEQHMAKHLRSLTAVTVRESHSLRYLQSIGVSANVLQVADSAFRLQRQHVDAGGFWPQGDGPVLGFNISPLVDQVRRRAGVQRDLIEESAEFIRLAIRLCGLRVLLVPHVAPLDPASANANNDESFLLRLATAVGRNPACGLVPPGLNACQLKDLIGRCDYFIGARTHATIASLSSGVPTLSIAYSVKARGINLDLFGSEDMVLDTRNVSAVTLKEGLDWLINSGPALREQLQARADEWQAKVVAGMDLVAKRVGAS